MNSPLYVIFMVSYMDKNMLKSTVDEITNFKKRVF